MVDGMSQLPAFAPAPGVVAGHTRTLQVDPIDDVSGGAVVVFTHAGAVRPIEASASVVGPVGAGLAPPAREVGTAAVFDLGGVVAEVVRLGPRPDAPELVVSCRAVDDRGRPDKTQAGVVLVGALLDGSQSDEDFLPLVDLLLGLMRAEDLAVTAAGRVLGRHDLEDERLRRHQAQMPTTTLAEQAARTLPLL